MQAGGGRLQPDEGNGRYWMRINDEVTNHYTTPTRSTIERGGRHVARRRRSARRMRRALAGVLIGLIIIASAGVAGYAAMRHAGSLQAALISDLQKGANDLLVAKAAVVKANSGKGDPAQLTAATRAFRSGRSHFQHA